MDTKLTRLTMEVVNPVEKTGGERFKASQVDEAGVHKVSQVNDSKVSVAKPIDLDHFMGTLNEMLDVKQSSLRFSKDDSSGRLVYKLIDTQSNELIRQYPSEDFLAESARIKAYLDEVNSDNRYSGALFDQFV